MRFSVDATRQVNELRRHFHARERPEAVRKLTADLREALALIRTDKGLAAPRPYPEMARPGEAWVHAGRYWIFYRTARPRMILAVFYDAADIPGRRSP